MMVPLSEASPEPTVGGRRQLLVELLPVAIVSIIMSMIGFKGYVGYDDYKYIQAALEWLDRGVVVGQSHWAIRHTFVLSLAAAIELFGFSDFAISLVARLCFVLLAMVSYVGVKSLFDRRTAALAVVFLVTTPLYATFSTTPYVLMMELLFLAGALFLLLWSVQRDRRQALWLFCCGILIALAVITRLTSSALVFGLCLATALFPAMRRARFFWIALGMAAVLLLDALFFWHFAGDILYRPRTAINHGNIATAHIEYDSVADKVAGEKLKVPRVRHKDMMSTMVENLKKPFSEEIRAQRNIRFLLLDVHWSINVYLMFIAHYAFGPVFLLLPLVWILCRTQRGVITMTPHQKHSALLILVLAGAWFVVLHYGLGLRPHPRYYAFTAYCLILILSIGAGRLLGIGRRMWWLTASLTALVALVGAFLTQLRESPMVPVKEAVRWAGELSEREEATLYVPDAYFHQRPIVVLAFSGRLLERIRIRPWSELKSDVSAGPAYIWHDRKNEEDLPTELGKDFAMVDSIRPKRTWVGLGLNWLRLDGRVPPAYGRVVLYNGANVDIYRRP